MHFPVSGVDAPVWVPPVVAFVVSSVTSMGGLSGAFLLLPFQMSVLGFVTPAVSSTNLVFNVVAIPSGVYRYVREGRMLWKLAWVVVAGTGPGVILGELIRVRWLPDPRTFKLFVACVLLYIGVRLVLSLRRTSFVPTPRDAWRARTLEASIGRLVFEFQGREYHVRTRGIFALSATVGVIGGIYGVGGGSIIAPFLVAVFGLPVHIVAGATLMGTFVTSLVGVLFSQVAGPLYHPGGVSWTPDWQLGVLFGLGGMAGTYAGARMQRYVPASWLKALLALVVLAIAVSYTAAYFLA